MADDATPPALVHFYRGELGRLAIYRVRLDTTTNWAIGVVVAVLTFTLGRHEAPHTLLLLPYLLVTVFLFVESRRFRELDMFRRRVRDMELSVFVPLLRGKAPLPTEASERIARSLEHAMPELPLLHAVASRLRRNYLWLYLAIFGGWCMKVYLEGARTPGDLTVGQVPGWFILLVAVATVVPWALLAVFPKKMDISPSQ